ncbi:hypothetical protein Leryth_025735 [Lithospermum erythrorhizon]|nr:hypothetical protein Leryth_025735 [Lithospermum erythrorhizon]
MTGVSSARRGTTTPVAFEVVHSGAVYFGHICGGYFGDFD